MNPPGRLDQLNEINPDLTLFSALDPGFEEYGRILTEIHSLTLLQTACTVFSESKGTSYTASHPELEACPETKIIGREIFKDTEIQAGCCWGDNTKMNGMEYHESSEVVGAATEMILILGKIQEIKYDRWNSSNAGFFYLPADTIVELYATTLHLAPCRVDENPFCAVIILPAGTNTPLEAVPDGFLWMKNKWMLAHPDGPAAAKGARIAIDGVNWEIRTL